MAFREDWDLDMIVVDDGSTDKTGQLAVTAGAKVIRQPTNGGYGLALQCGIRAARTALIGITDADGTYPVEELPALVKMVVEDGYDMAVGARQGDEYRRGWWKYPARIMFGWLAEYVAGRRIPDINSGLRVMKRERLLPHLANTCFGFSFTTSITLIFFLNGFFVGYRPIAYHARIGKSKVRHFKDTLRTAQILVSVITLYNPIKLFLLFSILCAAGALLSAVVACFTGWLWAQLLAVGWGIAIPIIFALGCLAEDIRFIRLQNK